MSTLHKQSGFTLIELLIALSISAVISVIAYQSVSSVASLQSRTEQHAEQLQSLQRAMWWMEQDFIQLAPRTVQDGLGTVLPAFSYREDLGVELTRIAEFPTPYGSGGLLRVGYQLQEQVLYRLVWPVLDRAPDTQPVKTPVLQGVESFAVRLLNQQNSYVDSWPSESQALTALPKLTQVTLKLQDRGELSRLFMGAELEEMPQTQSEQQSEQSPEANSNGSSDGSSATDPVAEELGPAEPPPPPELEVE